MTRRTIVVNAAIAGATDTAVFLVRRPGLFREAPGRAFGSVGFLGAWVALAFSAGRDKQSSGNGALTPALAALLVAGNAGMLAIHLRHHIAGPRVFLGAALSAVALSASIPA